MITMSVGEEFQLRLFFGGSFTLLLFSIPSIVLTEQTDSDVWGRPPITHVNGGYEGVIVAIHKNVPQDILLLNKTKEAIRKASENLYNATGNYLFFKDVVILIPSSWNMESYLTSNEMKFAEGGEDYERSHIRIRSSYDLSAKDLGSADGDSSSSSYDSSDSYCDEGVAVLELYASEPFVHQPGKCGEESAFIRVTPKFIENNSIWGDPANALVHLWGHFRWGLLDEYQHSPLNCANGPKDIQNSRCSSGIKHIYRKKTAGDGNSYERMALEEVCSNSDKDYDIDSEVKTDIPEYVTGSIMSVSSNNMINEFCHNSPNKSSSSKHNGGALNRQNRMCQNKSSWEVMEKHPDFAGDSKTMFKEPTFTIMMRKTIRKLVLINSTATISQSCGMLPYSDDCYILRSLALSDSSGKIGIVDNENNYLMDAEFEMEVNVNSLTDPSVEIVEVIVLENASNSLIDRFFNSIRKVNFTKCTLIGENFKTFPQLHRCQYSTVSEYLENIHYDDVEEFVRVLSEEGTINETSYSKEFEFTLDGGIGEGLTILLLHWDNGNMTILGSSLQSVYISETLAEKRIDEDSFSVGENVPFTLEKTGPETVTFRLEVFSKASVSEYDVGRVRVRPYLKSSSVVTDCASAITIYTSVTQYDKPILRAEVVAKVSASAGSMVDAVLKDSYEDFEDGIYSADFIPFNGSDNYTIDVKAKGEAGQTIWNVEGLQPSGVLPDVISVRKLDAEPVILQTNFERSPRSLSLEVYCKGSSTAPSSTRAETTFPVETTQTTERLTSETLTSSSEMKTYASTTELIPDETTAPVGTSFDPQTTKAPSSTSSGTTFLNGIIQTTELSTSENLTNNGEKSTGVSTIVQTSEETTTPFDITFHLQTTEVTSSAYSETTFRNGIIQTTELSTSKDLTTHGEKSTGVSTIVPTSEETTTPFATTFHLQTTKGHSSTHSETTFLNGITQTTELSSSRDLTTNGEKGTGVATIVPTSEETSTPFATTFHLQTTEVPSSTSSGKTFLNGILQTTELSTSEDLTTNGEKSIVVSTSVLKSDEMRSRFDTTFRLQTTEVPSSTHSETTFLNGIIQTTELSTSENLTTNGEKSTGESTIVPTSEETTTPFATTFHLQTTKVPSSTRSETTFLNLIIQTTELSTSESSTSNGEKSTFVSTSVPTSEETTTPFDTTFHLKTSEVPPSKVPSSTHSETTFRNGIIQTTELFTSKDLTTNGEKSTGESTIVPTSEETTTPFATTFHLQTTGAVFTTDAHIADFDGTKKEMSKFTTSDTLTKPSEMTSYSSLKIFATEAISSTLQKLTQLSTTTAGRSTPPIRKGGK